MVVEYALNLIPLLIIALDQQPESEQIFRKTSFILGNRGWRSMRDWIRYQVLRYVLALVTTSDETFDRTSVWNSNRTGSVLVVNDVENKEVI